jgi:hypothetical protein
MRISPSSAWRQQEAKHALSVSSTLAGLLSSVSEAGLPGERIEADGSSRPVNAIGDD